MSDNTLPESFEVTLNSDKSIVISPMKLAEEMDKAQRYFHHLVMTLLKDGGATCANPGMAMLVEVASKLTQVMMIARGPNRVQIPGQQMPMGRA